jgi:phosphoketolase
MVILRSPKGWTGPKAVEGKQTEGSFRSHQVPMGDMDRPGHVKPLEKWRRATGLRSCSTSRADSFLIDAMFNQHAKWLKVSKAIAWRRSIASLNYLPTSHVWRQDHNGFSHQDPGFIDHVVNKKADIIRVYLPPDANTLLSVTDHCLRSRNYVNVIVAGKQPALQWLDMDAAVKHCIAGLGIWSWASNDRGGEPEKARRPRPLTWSC